VVVHRDLKPDNLFVTTKKVTKVLDFGIAKALDDAERETPTTIAETTMGTPQYVPPELWDGDQLPTPASDVYSLGITLYEAVTGRHPFDEPNQKLGKKKEAYRETHREKAVKPLLQVRPDAPESLAKVVARATEKNPLSRYPNAKEFGEALRAVQRELAALKERPLPPDVDLSVPIGGATHTTLPLPKPPAELTVPKPLINLPEPPEPEASRRLPVWLAPSAAGATILGIVLAAIVWHRNQDADKLPPLQPSAVVSSSSTPPASSASMAPVVPVPPPQCPANMVLIPKGTFKMGSDEGSSNEKPVHDVPVDAFCMDETEVTVEAYGACVLSKGCASASHTVLWFLYSAADVTLWSRFCNANRAGHEKHPINCVDWNMADTYCKKNDKRLPTEKEWEYSARGTDGRKYPWDPQKGEPRDGLLNACGSECVAMGKSHGQTWAAMYKEDDGFPDTAPVGSFPEGKSFHKVLDMAGNVNEWTDTFYTSNYENNNSNGGDERVIRGGSWYDEDASNVRGATRRSNAPANRIGNDLGFRCAGTPR
jgi:formylglycine-generating enzyme required for sulfatase activity